MASLIRVADHIANFIVSKKINDFFLLPGGGAMYLVDALGNHEKLNFVACHHEQAAVIAAEAYARITENFGVALVTTGPGATNAITAVAGAWIESVPLMIISGQVKREDRIKERKIRQGGVQEVDIVPIVSSCTKYAITIEDPNSIHFHLEKAYTLMMGERRGPVWIDVPLDIQGALIDPEKLYPFQSVDNKTFNIDESKIEKLIDMISQSQRPLIFAGHGVRLSGAAQKFRTLVESMKIPVVTSWNAMDILPHSHRLFAGKPGVVAPRAGNFAVQNCDLLITIGSRLDNVLTAYNPKRFAEHAKRVIADIDINEIENHPIDFDLTINADAKNLIEVLLRHCSKVSKKENEEWIKQCGVWKERYALEKEFDFDDKSISHFQFSDILSRNLNGGELISTGSSGLGIEAFYVAFNIKEGQRIFLTSGLGAMGYGLPAAIGACIANGRKPMVAVESDGSLQLNIQELATLKGQNLPIALFIMDNAGYASIRNTQRNYFDGRYVATGKESGLHMPNIHHICKAYELRVSVVESVNELEENIPDISMLNEPIVIVVKTLKDEILMPKASAIPQPDGSMISMPIEDMIPLLDIEELKTNMNGKIEEASIRARKLSGESV